MFGWRSDDDIVVEGNIFVDRWAGFIAVVLGDDVLSMLSLLIGNLNLDYDCVIILFGHFLFRLLG